MIFRWQNPCHISNPEFGNVYFIPKFYGDTSTGRGSTKIWKKLANLHFWKRRFHGQNADFQATNFFVCVCVSSLHGQYSSVYVCVCVCKVCECVCVCVRVCTCVRARLFHVLSHAQMYSLFLSRDSYVSDSDIRVATHLHTATAEVCVCVCV